MTTKYVPPPMKVPKVPEIITSSTPRTSAITKFLPFICAGAAVGVSILALKELKKIKAEMILVKNQQQSSIQVKQDPTLSKKLEQLEEQLKRVNLYLANKDKSGSSKILKNVLKTEIPKEIKIIKAFLQIKISFY